MSEPTIIYNTNEVKFKETKLIDENGVFYGKFDLGMAIKRAYLNKMDLVCFNEPDATGLALCKIIDYNKWKYNSEKAKKKSENSQSHKTKEFQFSTCIGAHDIQHKCNQMKEALDRGHGVIMCIKVNMKNEKQKALAGHKTEEIISFIDPFAKVVTKKINENRIEIVIAKK